MIGRQMLALAAVAAMTLPASARTGIWSVTGTGEETAVIDCTDCEEDIGILIRCQAAGEPAKLYVPFQARDALPSDRDTSEQPEQMVFTVDGQRHAYAPDFEEWGMIGHVPIFPLKRSDPLVEALRRGQSVDVSLGGVSIRLPLKGSWTALSIFDQRCPWGDGSEATTSASGTGANGGSE